MQRLEVSVAVRPLSWPLGVKGLILSYRLCLGLRNEFRLHFSDWSLVCIPHVPVFVKFPFTLSPLSRIHILKPTDHEVLDYVHFPMLLFFPVRQVEIFSLALYCQPTKCNWILTSPRHCVISSDSEFNAQNREYVALVQKIREIDVAW